MLFVNFTRIEVKSANSGDAMNHISQVHAMSLEMIILLIDEEAGDVKRCMPLLPCYTLQT